MAPLRAAAVNAKRMLQVGDKRGAVEVLKAITDACLSNVRLYQLCDDPDRIYELLDCHLEQLWAEVLNDPEETMRHWEVYIGDDDRCVSREEVWQEVDAQEGLPSWMEQMPTCRRTEASEVRRVSEECRAFERLSTTLAMGQHPRLGEDSVLHRLPQHLVQHITSFLPHPTSTGHLLSRAEVEVVAGWLEAWQGKDDSMVVMNLQPDDEKPFYIKAVKNYALFREADSRPDMCFGPPLTAKDVRRVAECAARSGKPLAPAEGTECRQLLSVLSDALRDSAERLHRAQPMAYVELVVALPMSLKLRDFEATMRACSGAVMGSLPPGVRRFRFYERSAMRAAFGDGHPALFAERQVPFNDVGGWLTGPGTGPHRYWIDELELEWVSQEEVRLGVWPCFATFRTQYGMGRWSCGVTSTAVAVWEAGPGPGTSNLPPATPLRRSRLSQSACALMGGFVAVVLAGAWAWYDR